jgi:hypothetical protein
MRTILAVFLASAFLLSSPGVPASADAPLPDSATIYANVRAARGDYPRDYLEVLTGSDSNGATWTEFHYVDGDNYRDDDISGPIETQEGEYKGDAWHQNANGLTVIHAPEPGLATKETFATTVTRISVPVSGYRVATLSPRGYGTVDYVDQTTWQIVREETVGAGGISFETFGPRTVLGGQKLEQTRHYHDADTGVDTDITVVSFQPSVVADQDVAIPTNRRTLVEFPPNVTSAVLPTTFRNGRIYVMVTIDGRGYDFLLDSGSYGIAVDPAAAAKLGLKLFGKEKNDANAGKIDTAGSKIGSLKIGPLSMRDIIVNVIPVMEENDGVRCIGLLGFDFLAELGVRIDYDNEVVRVDKYGSFAPPAGPDVNVIPVRLDSQVPFVSATINGAIAERITVDTGGDGPFLLFNFFARRHPEALVDRYGGGVRSDLVSFEGVGGEVKTRPYELANIVLGSTRFVNFIGYLVTSNSYGSAVDGVFGIGFLRYYDVYLDYPDGRIALRLNATGKRARVKHAR